MNPYQRRHEAAEKMSRARWERNGWITDRFATKSPTDFFAFRLLDWDWRIVEVKAGKRGTMSPQQRQRRAQAAHHHVTEYYTASGKLRLLRCR